MLNNKRKTELDKAVEDQEEEFLEPLAGHVMACFDRARRHRDNTGITDTLKDCLRRFRGKYTDDELCKFQGISVYRGLTGMLVRSAHAWLKDAYFNAQDRPWTIDPTPQPELPEFLRDQLQESIEAVLSETLTANGMQTGGSGNRQIISELKNTASDLAFKYSKERTEAMTRVIEDQMVEANFRDVLSEHLLDVCIYPYAVLKGPVVRKKKIPVWVGDEYKFKNEPRYYVERIDPMNFYPSPDSTNAQDGEFTIELIPMSRARLNEAKTLPHFEKEAINLVIDSSDDRYERQSSLQSESNDLEELDGVGRKTTSVDGSLFDVYEFHGRIPGEHLIDFHGYGEELDDLRENMKTIDTDWGEIDPYEDYECVVWVCDGIVIMARLNKPNPIPYRPYFVTSCYKIPGSIYGESIPMVIADLQDELNDAARARVFNMGMSSGPIAEADHSRFGNNDVPQQIAPWAVYSVTTNTAQNNNSAPAIRFTDIPNYSGPLTAVMEEAWDKAHRISGIPPYMYGDNMGAAPTLGAFSLQYANATKGIKNIISNIDHDVIEKLIQQFYYWNMYYSKDESIKADARVNVRGAAGLIAQEQRQARPLELLNALGPILAQMSPEVALGLAEETLSESGYDPKSLGGNQVDRESRNRLVGVGGPSVDGRSGNVSQTLNSQQLPTPVG